MRLTFASEAKFEIEAKILFHLEAKISFHFEAKKKPDFTFFLIHLDAKHQKSEARTKVK